MIACAILGDSLAADVALYRHDCVADTKMGITSSVYAAALTMTVNADTVLISLGINDGIPDVKLLHTWSGCASASTQDASTGSCQHGRR